MGEICGTALLRTFHNHDPGYEEQPHLQVADHLAHQKHLMPGGSESQSDYLALTHGWH
jgi:hypothetical protein